MTYPVMLTLTQSAYDELLMFIYKNTGRELKDLVHEDPDEALDYLQAVIAGISFDRMRDVDSGRIKATSQDDGAEAIDNYHQQSLDRIQSIRSYETVEISLKVRRKPTLRDIISGNLKPASEELQFIVEPKIY